MRREQSRSDALKARALAEVFDSEITEWYRNQYNIPLKKFYQMKIDEDLIYLDLYRRQYWNELRFGARKWGDTTLEFAMPSFTLFRQFGGVLPPANGFGIDNSFTVKAEHYKDDASPNSETQDGDGVFKTESYNYSSNPSDPWSAKSHVEKSSFGVKKEEFDELMKKAETDDSFWEELDTLNPEAE